MIIDDERQIKSQALARHRAEELRLLAKAEQEAHPPKMPSDQDNEPHRRPILRIRA